ncbi:MAG: family 3 adenylate cyclase [Chitinophagaceae bacterium]|nr:family 3 adenylate cyclase [Chitinophagaceae bacterium]
MRSRFIFLCPFLLCCIWCAGQSVSVDSLKAMLAASRNDTVKVNLLLQIGAIYRNTDPQLAIPYTLQAKELSSQLNYEDGLARSYKYTGLAYYQQSMYIEAMDNYNHSLQVFKKMNNKVGISNIQNNIGVIYKEQGLDSKALEFFFNSLKNAEETGDVLRITTALNNIGSVYQHKMATYNKALEYYLRALPVSRQLGDNDLIGATLGNIGEIYLQRKNSDSALYYFKKQQQAYQSTADISYALNNIGKVYDQKKDYTTALEYHQQAYDSAVAMNSILYMAQSLQGLANTYDSIGNYEKALESYSKAEHLAKDIKSSYDLKDIYNSLSFTYSRLSDYKNAYKYQNLLVDIKDSIYNKEGDLKLSSYEFNFEIQKKQGLIDLQEVSIARQKLARNAFIIGFSLILVIALILYRNYRNKIKVNKILDTQKAQIEGLLLNILPAEVSKELQQKGEATPRFYESVSVLFTDFKGFTKIADSLSPQEVVAELSECFVAFDEIIDRNGLEKIKTIGDAYMCAGGIPVSNTTHPVNIVKAGLEIVQFMKQKNEKRTMSGLEMWELRVGVHTGPVVAGVVGKKKYAYDIWGTTVNIASRMESNGEPGQINISMATYELVKHEFECYYRGKIYAKNVGEIDMYFIKENIQPEPVTTGVISDVKLMSES